MTVDQPNTAIDDTSITPAGPSSEVVHDTSGDAIMIDSAFLPHTNVGAYGEMILPKANPVDSNSTENAGHPSEHQAGPTGTQHLPALEGTQSAYGDDLEDSTREGAIVPPMAVCQEQAPKNTSLHARNEVHDNISDTSLSYPTSDPKQEIVQGGPTLPMGSASPDVDNAPPDSSISAFERATRDLEACRQEMLKIDQRTPPTSLMEHAAFHRGVFDDMEVQIQTMDRIHQRLAQFLKG
jgi:hypothetical protein